MVLQKQFGIFQCGQLCTIILKHIFRATLENLELNDAASQEAEENEELSRTPVSIDL